MLKKLVPLFLVTALFFACAKKEEKADVKPVKPEIVKLTVDEFYGNAAELKNKEIEISGTIVHVCHHGGKRAHIIGTNPDTKVKLECTDEVEKFDRKAEGSEVVAKGIVDALVIDEAYLNNWETEIKKSGESNKNLHDGHEKDHEGMSEQEENLEKIKAYRKRLKESGKDKLEYYSVKLKSFKIKKAK